MQGWMIGAKVELLPKVELPGQIGVIQGSGGCVK